MGTTNLGLTPFAPFLLDPKGLAGCASVGLGGILDAIDYECIAEKFADKVEASDYDFLVLNEVFADAGKDVLVERLSDSLPYSIYELDENSLFRSLQDSGLMLFSAWPFAERTAADLDCFDPDPLVSIVWNAPSQATTPAIGFIPFEDCAGNDCFSSKGVGFARLLRPDAGSIDVFFTHLQSPYGQDQDYEDWHDESLEIHRRQLEVVANFVRCIRADSPAETAVLAGDLNIEGDLSNPYFDLDDGTQLAADCSLETGTCASQSLGPDDTCQDIGNPLDPFANVCRDVEQRRNRFLYSRAEWDYYFNAEPGTEPFPGHPMRDLFKDTWAEFMTGSHVLESGPEACKPAFGADPPCPPFEPYLREGVPKETEQGFFGLIEFDRGTTSIDPLREKRIDYIMLQDSLDFPGNSCAQHVTVAYNLQAGMGGEGGITSLPKATREQELIAGSDPLADHIGLNAEINLEAEHCSPSDAVVLPEPSGPEQEPWRAKLPYRGAVHWYRIDQPGTWTFSVNPINQEVPWLSDSYSNGLTYRVYERTDLSRPMDPYKGEVIEVAPTLKCEFEDHCQEVPGFTEYKVHAAEPPFYVKVYHPSLDYPAGWHGEYLLLYKRVDCTSVDEACAIEAYEGTSLDLNNEADAFDDTFSVNAGARRRFDGEVNSPLELWYSIHVDDPDGPIPQTFSLRLIEDGPVGPEPRIASVELYRSDGMSPVTRSGQPFEISGVLDPGTDRWVWDAADNSGALEFDSSNSVGRRAKYYVKVTRTPPLGPGDELNFSLFWTTNLTWLYGPDLGGDHARITCYDSTDLLSDDELYMQIEADGVRYPLGAQSGESEDGLDLDSGLDEGVETEDWTHKNIPRLGLNSHGNFFEKAIRFVSGLQIQLIEDDGFLTFGDDVSSRTLSPLGPVSGDRTLPTINFYGEDYKHRGGSSSHDVRSKPCGDHAGVGGCALPLACVNGVCRPDSVPDSVP